MVGLDTKIEAARRALEELTSKEQHDSLVRETELLQLNVKAAAIKTAMQAIQMPVHVYSSFLNGLQVPSPPSSVIQTQAQLCRAWHGFDSQSHLLEKTTVQCTDMVRLVRNNIRSLEDECVSMEVELLKQIALADEMVLQCMERNEKLLGSQHEQLNELRSLNGLSEEESSLCGIESKEKSMSEALDSEMILGDSMTLAFSRISKDLKIEFATSELNNAMSKSFRRISDELKTELVGTEAKVESTPTLSFRTISDFFSPTMKRNDDALFSHLMDSFSSNLHMETFSMPIRFTPTTPVA